MTIQIFEKHPFLDAYRVGAAFAPYAVMAADKRFTDAELAAEYWAAYAKAGSMRLTSHAGKHEAWRLMVERFAQHAHFDEVTER